MNESHQLEPVCAKNRVYIVIKPVYFTVQPVSMVTFVWVSLADALGRLEGVEEVGEVHIGIRLIHQLV